MCGRYAANRDTGTLTDVFKLKNLPSQLLPENYNISPTSKTYAITVDKNRNRTLEIMTWGLIPSWAKDNSMSAKMINARYETVDEKPSFRSAFSKRRCIIPMDGYFEWFRPEDPKEKKQPYFIEASKTPLLAVAGIYEIWKNPDKNNFEQDVYSFSIITTEAKLGLEVIHDRMPVLVPDKNWDAWLDSSLQNKDEIRSLIATPPDEYFNFFKISSDVNNARNNGINLIKPLEI